MMNVRRLALEGIERIIEEGSYSNLVVNELLRKYTLSAENRTLLTKLIYGTIERLITIEFYLEPYIKKEPPKWVKYLLYLSVYQLLYLDIPLYAVLNEAVALTKRRNPAVAGFVNAVLRNFLRNELRSTATLEHSKSLSILYSHPLWIVEKLLEDYSEEVVEKILKNNLTVQPLGIRVNTLKANKDDIKEEIIKAGYHLTETNLVSDGFQVEGNIQHSTFFKEGLITIQDLASQRVAEIMEPKAERIIDLCSAPGGKTAHLAALMENKGEVIACDIHPHKLKLMENSFHRLEVKNVQIRLLDAREALNEFGSQSFEQVLADVPCSGLGVMAHKVDLKYHLQAKDLDAIIKLQSEILNKSWELVRPGGYYNYSTCTINKDENERQIESFLTNHPDAKVVSSTTILPFTNLTDGFFICRMRRE